jgi:hypothetical protein
MSVFSDFTLYYGELGASFPSGNHVKIKPGPTAIVERYENNVDRMGSDAWGPLNENNGITYIELTLSIPLVNFIPGNDPSYTTWLAVMAFIRSSRRAINFGTATIRGLNTGELYTYMAAHSDTTWVLMEYDYVDLDKGDGYAGIDATFRYNTPTTIAALNTLVHV